MYYFVMFIYCLSNLACTGRHETARTFTGDPAAIAQAEAMFAAIGGKEAWCALRNLYIKAEHTEPQMTIPYTSEIWRAIDTFELVIEQQNDSFHVKGIFSPDKGEIHYLDARDTMRVLSTAQLNDWAFDHQHNVYVLLHDLACDPDNYRVELDDEGMLAFYQNTLFVTRFGLDEEMRPYMFYRPNPDGSVSGSIFTHWGTDDGLVHSAGGHPLDSNFIYRTEIWQPSQEPLREAFGEEIMRVE